MCRDGSLPRSGLLYAKQVDDRGYFSESTYERVDGRLRLTVIQGVSYNVHGQVLVPARTTRPDGNRCHEPADASRSRRP